MRVSVALGGQLSLCRPTKFGSWVHLRHTVVEPDGINHGDLSPHAQSDEVGGHDRQGNRRRDEVLHPRLMTVDDEVGTTPATGYIAGSICVGEATTSQCSVRSEPALDRNGAHKSVDAHGSGDQRQTCGRPAASGKILRRGGAGLLSLPTPVSPAPRRHGRSG